MYTFIIRAYIISNMITIKEILNEMQYIKNWKKSTYNFHERTIENYCTYNRLSLQELINEAEEDEYNIMKPRKRRINKRLKQYQLHLIKKGLNPSSINIEIARIKAVYKYLDIEVPPLNKLRTTNTEQFKDLPTKDEIRKALDYSKTPRKALITFAVSTGLRCSDIANLTIQDFINATREYHHGGDIYTILTTLQTRKYVTPVWDITSIKTGINHITFNTPECTEYIIQMLKERYMKTELSPEDSLFNVKSATITKSFQRINDRLGFGRKGNVRRFHPHGLRKYFGTSLTNNGMDFLSTEFLLGHTLNKVQSSYYFGNPDNLKNKYLHYMDVLTFNSSVNYIDVTTPEKRELKELRAYKAESEARILQLEEMVNFINRNIQ